MMRIYASRDLVAPGVPAVLMLQPFWGAWREDPRRPTAGRFAKYLAEADGLFELTDAASADIHVYPHPYDQVACDPATADRVSTFQRRAAAERKPAVIFIGSDSENAVPLDEGWIFRLALSRETMSRATRRLHQFAMPAWSEDFVTQYLEGRLPVRRKGPMPIVGFCGFAASSSMRSQALGVLSRSNEVETRFINHSQFWAGAIARTWGGGRYAARMRAARRQFVDNLVDSDYALCVRGAGNFSFRLYEALCCGRIPLFVDTGGVLPYEDAIDWKRLCVWVDGSDLHRIDRIVADYHAALSDREFEERQRECRAIWEEWLSPIGFHRHFALHFPGG
jgi:hypothetical protein